MNSSYEEKKRFNIIDFIIILGVLIIAASIIFRTQIITFFSADASNDEYTLTFEIELINNEDAALIDLNDTLTWIENDISFGTIKELSAPKKASIYEKDQNGNIIFSLSETQSTLTGTINLDAITNNGCYVDGMYFVGAGMTVTLATKNVQFTAIITAVTNES